MEKEHTSCTTRTGLERGRCEIDAFVYDLIETGCSAGEIIWCHVFMADCSFMAVYMLPCSAGTQQAVVWSCFVFNICLSHHYRDDSLRGNTNSDSHGRRVSSSPMLSAAFDVGKRLVRARLMISPPIQAHRPWPVHEGRRLRGRRQTSFRGNRVCRRWRRAGGAGGHEPNT